MGMAVGQHICPVWFDEATQRNIPWISQIEKVKKVVEICFTKYPI